MNKTFFVTGSAGFIGSNLVLKLLKENENIHIIGIDNMNDYYDVSIKEYRLNKIKEEVKKTTNKWSFYYGNISDKKLIDKIFEEYKPDIVVNLAAQAGVRYSISNPDAYIESNLIGFYNILEACSILMMMETKVWNTLFMHRQAVFMDLIRKYHIVQMIK